MRGIDGKQLDVQKRMENWEFRIAYLVRKIVTWMGSQDEQIPLPVVATSGKSLLVKEINPIELLVQEALQIAKTTNKQVMAVVNTQVL